VEETPESVTVRGNGFEVVFDRKTGSLASYRADGEEFVSGSRPDLWRPYTDNDEGAMRGGKKLGGKLEDNPWRTAAEKRTVSSFKVEAAEDAAKVSLGFDFPGTGAKAGFVYGISGNGSVEVAVEYDYSAIPKPQRNAHRTGMQWQLAGGLENLKWYGRGPSATYVDRNFERIGLYSGAVDAQWVDYSRPQENGNKTDVRWVTLTDGKGRGLRFETLDGPVGVGARFYSDATMEATEYSFQMERSGKVFFNIDAHQLGVGGNDSWGATPLENEIYFPRKDRYAYRFRMSPIRQPLAPAESRLDSGKGVPSIPSPK
jgi:beta-galactosidase